MVDMYIDNSDPSENVGQIHFSLEYDFQNTTLILKIIQVSIPIVIVLPFFLLDPIRIYIYATLKKLSQQDVEDFVDVYIKYSNTLIYFILLFFTASSLLHM